MANPNRPSRKAPKIAHRDPRMLVERPLPRDGRDPHGGKPARSVTVNLAESPLGWLHARGHLDDRQFDAGEKLRWDWERAQLAPNITMNWDMAVRDRGRRGPPTAVTQGEAQLAAKQRFTRAMRELGRDLQDIAWRVICAGEGVPVAEKGLGWPTRSGKLVLRIALDRLADFYRLPGG